MTSSIDTLLRAAQFLEEQELQEQLGTFYQPISTEKENISTDEINAQVPVEAPIVETPIIVTTHPNIQYTTEPITIELPHSLPLPLTIPNGIINNVTLYNIDESHASLNLSTGSSGYSTSSLGNSSLNQSAPAEDLVVVELEKNVAVPEQFDENFLTQQQQQLSSFNPLQIPSSLLIERRRTISSNSNSGALRSPSTVRAGTREVHNKLEKNRRAHLKECFESLKKQLPITADEKKTSNLSILGAAIRHIQFLRRKEREFEHEMERLAKEKISAQNRILFLKRELAQWDIDFSKLIPEPDINSIKSERAFTETSNENAGKNGIKYSSTSSLSSITTASSACASNVTSTTNLSPSIIHNTSITPSSPPSTNNLLTSSVGGSSIMMVPLAFNSKQLLDDCSKFSNKPSKSTSIATTSNQHLKNNILPLTSSSQLLSLKPSDILLPTSAGGVTFSHCQTIPLNLHTTTLGTIHHTPKNFYGAKEPTPMNGLKNGIKNFNVNEKYNKSGITSNINHLQTSMTTTTSKLDSNEPPTKLIKLINGSAILSPMDKDKMLHSGQLTLSQVVGGGGLVVSPIQLLNSSQGLRVIGQSNGLTTIELSTPQMNNHHQQHRHIMGQQSTNVAQLQKLLMNGSAATTTHLSIPTIPQISHQQQQFRLGPELSRLAGGAELNLLPNNSQPNTIYRGQSGKIAIINNNITMNESSNSNRIQMIQPTPIVVSHGQSANLTHVITTNSQIGKVITTTTTNQNLQSGTQYLNKSMVVVNNDTSKNSSKSHN